jgi:hypothetical protein
MRHLLGMLAAATAAGLALGACDDGGGGGAADAGTDLDTDTDTDTDVDTDTDADTDTASCTGVPWEGDYAIDGGADLAGLVGYEAVQGDLSITADDLSDLDGLQCLSEVEGSLRVIEATALASLAGLQGLDVIGGDLEILDAAEGGVGVLANATLPSLSSLGGDLRLRDHPELEILSISDLGGVGGTFDLTGNEALTTVTALDLAVINGDFVFVGNDDYEDFDGLNTLAVVDGDVKIYDNGALPYCRICDLLDQLSGFDGALELHDNITDPCWVDSTLTCP